MTKPIIFIAILSFLLLSIAPCSAEKNDNPQSITVSGRPCKGFDPKTDKVSKVDEQGNCLLYTRPNDSGYVSGFLYNADGELEAKLQRDFCKGCN